MRRIGHTTLTLALVVLTGCSALVIHGASAPEPDAGGPSADRPPVLPDAGGDASGLLTDVAVAGIDASSALPDAMEDVVQSADGSPPLQDVGGDAPPFVDVPPACPVGLVLCATVCVDTTSSLQNCGGCDQACVVPTGGTATCVAGACSAMCPAGMTNCSGACTNSACTNDPPRQIAPLSTATVSSQLPTLRWHWPADEATTIAHVEICSDRACAHVVRTIDARGSSGAPGSALAYGLYFWHVRASSGSVYSPVWEFWVGHRSAAVNTSTGSTLDVNGDGIPDLVVGAPANGGMVSGTAYVYPGIRDGFEASPTTLTGPLADDAYGAAVASAGDVNGDGFADALVGAYWLESAYLYLGGPGGVSTTPAATIAPLGAYEFGIILAGAGDVNGDGYADVVIGGGANAYVYLGSSEGLGASPITLTGFGNFVASAGDVNGDGLADLIIGYDEFNAVHVFYGSSDGALRESTALSVLVDRDQFALGCAGDLNGDGYSDVVVGTSVGYMESAYVYLGGASGLGATPIFMMTTPTPEENGGWGNWVASAGDVNGDGFDDLLVGTMGNALVYPGTISGLSASPITLLPGTGRFVAVGLSVASLGDVNADGFADVVVGANGATFYYFGSASGIGSEPMTLAVPPGASGFGDSVACASR